MRRELSSAYRTVENRAQSLLRIYYYTKDTPLNTVVVFAAIKIIVLLGAILVPALSAFGVVLKSRIPGKLGREIVSKHRVPEICL
jgi:hypothetical protein